MSNQDEINYLLSIQVKNTMELESIKQTMGSLDESIEQLNMNIEQNKQQLSDCNTQIDNLNQGNIYIDSIIKTLGG